jgi:hypothetical protein
MPTSCQIKKKPKSNYVLFFLICKYKWSTKAMKMYNWLRVNVYNARYYSWITLYFKYHIVLK